MEQLNIKIMKIIEKNVAEILVLVVLIFVMSSCQTVREIKGNTNNLRCTHVSRQYERF